jgi:hypothetical protein
MTTGDPGQPGEESVGGLIHPLGRIKTYLGAAAPHKAAAAQIDYLWEANDVAAFRR